MTDDEYDRLKDAAINAKSLPDLQTELMEALVKAFAEAAKKSGTINTWAIEEPVISPKVIGIASKPVKAGDVISIQVVGAFPPNPPEARTPMSTMNLVQFAGSDAITQGLSDEQPGTIEVYLADPDGELFELTHVIYDPDKRRLYLVRAWHTAEEGNVKLDTELPAKMNVATGAYSPTPKDIHDTPADWDEEDAPATGTTNSGDEDW
jgi:hypothetical protein